VGFSQVVAFLIEKPSIIVSYSLRMYNKYIPLCVCIGMKKRVVVDLEYMTPSVGRGRGGGSGGSSGESDRDEDTDNEALNIDCLLQKHDGSDDDLSDDAGITTTTDDDDEYEPSPSPPPPPTRQHPSIRDSDYAVNSDDDLLQSVIDEPTFPLDINAILSAMNKTENSTIANLTLKKIAARRHEILSSLNLTPEKMAEFERKLVMYRVIESPHDLKHNQLIRWIPMRSLETRPYLTLGGTLFRVRENVEEGVHVVTIRNVKRFVFNIKFEVNVVFQRLSQDEMLILRAVEYVGDGDDTPTSAAATALTR
jgi:hypothetical protein